jgi:GR25 family glycosyltransferase involved in LPS biosynthesis
VTDITPYIISLSKIESSITSATSVFDSLTQYGFDPTLFEGTYGNDAEELFLKKNITLKSTHTSDNLKMSGPGVKGCFHSHYSLWKECVRKNTPIMIFEDDVIFYRNYEPVEFLDVLVLSINYDWKLSKKYSTYLENTSKNSCAFDPALSVMPGCSGYIIKPHAAERLVEEYSNSYLPADLAINSSICKIEMHSRLMGRSKTLDEKESLTRSRAWV